MSAVLESSSQIAVAHQPCPDCGSSDALSWYDDGHGYCFACPPEQAYKKGTGNFTIAVDTINRTAKVKPVLVETMRYAAIPSRKILLSTAHRYSCGTMPNGDIKFVYKDGEGKVIAAKCRNDKKDFWVEGDLKSAGLYGQNLFNTGGKAVTLTEGEFDAMAAYQMQGSKYPCVSIKSGAQGALKDCQAAYDWLNGFEAIYVCFDADDAGRKAARAVGDLFGAKAKIVTLRKGKDACDYLAADMVKEFTDEWWRAEPYASDGIVNTATLWELVSAPIEKAPCQYPWEGLNSLTYGIRPGELVVISAGTGLGKSQILREICYHILKTTEDRIGMLFLEESVRRSMLGLMSISANKPLHLPTTEVTPEEKRTAFEDTHGTGKICMFDHFGSLEVDHVIARVRELAKARECKYIFLDHITMIVSAGTNGDERKALDEVMTKLRMLVQETGIALFAVSHLKRPEGKGHEEGAVTTLAQLRGSGSIGQLSDMVIGLERNGQAADLRERNTTHVRVLKNRFAGLTGPACDLLYHHDTCRMHEPAMEAL